MGIVAPWCGDSRRDRVRWPISWKTSLQKRRLKFFEPKENPQMLICGQACLGWAEAKTRVGKESGHRLVRLLGVACRLLGAPWRLGPAWLRRQWLGAIIS